jgi:hypothetical protein
MEPRVRCSPQIDMQIKNFFVTLIFYWWVGENGTPGRCSPQIDATLFFNWWVEENGAPGAGAAYKLILRSNTFLPLNFPLVVEENGTPGRCSPQIDIENKHFLPR